MANVDDVDFMQEHSEKDSAIFLIDSGNRNRRFYPDPSEYLVHFSEPIRNVFGLDILDASIPGTMYNIDYHNCLLRYYLVSSSEDDVSKEVVGKEYTSAFEVMACSSAFVNAMNKVSADYDVFLCGDVMWESIKGNFDNLAASTIVVITYSIRQAYLIVLQDALVQAIGIDTSRTTWLKEGVFYFVSRGVWYSVTDADIIALLQTKFDNDDVCVLSIHNPSLTSPFTHDIVFTYSYNVDIKEFQGDHDDKIRFIKDMRFHEWHMLMRSMTVELGNYNIASLGSTLSDAFGRLNFSVISASSGNLEKQNKYVFTNGNYPFIFDMKNSTMRQVLGFDSLPPMSSTQIPDNDLLFMSFYDAYRGGFVLNAPGIVNLLGVRYLTLRCPEIEDHIHGSRAYGLHSTGVGVFKLPSPNEVAQLRFDFVNLIRKPFHPIGKITRLTFKFEFEHGVKYDFKGINHQILITMKYYSPPRVPRPPKSTLNPDYHPNYHQYMQKIADYAERSDDDNTPEQRPMNNNSAGRGRPRMPHARPKYDASELRKLLLLEQQYDHSTTDEDDDDSLALAIAAGRRNLYGRVKGNSDDST